MCATRRQARTHGRTRSRSSARQAPPGTAASSPLAHNGNLINAVELHARLRAEGVSFASTSDSEIIAALIASHPAERIEDAAAAVMPDLLGAFSTVLMTKDRVLAMRDPLGLRPLAIGRLAPLAQGGPPRYCIASETCAHDILGAGFVRDVRPGEVVMLDDEGLHSIQVIEPAREAFCVFEYIYFARPRFALQWHRVAGDPRPDGRDPRARGAGGRRPRDPCP